MNADDFTTRSESDDAVPDIRKADTSYDWHAHLIKLGDKCWDEGNTDYARQMYLEAMAHLDDCYEELGVTVDHER